MRRKNGLKTCGRESGDGVDLNRNFGHKWAHDSIGSSGSGCSEEYRGTAAFSEPETQAIRALVKEPGVLFFFPSVFSFFYRRSARWSRSTARRQRCTGAGCSGSEAVVVANGGGAAAESGSGAGREPKQCGAGHGWGARSRII